jgi:voltage-gated potassium channel
MSSAILLYAIFTLLIFSYGSLAMYRFEAGYNKNITNFYDVLWLCFTTLSTVGYGDVFPVTIEGRLVAMLFVIVGACFWALLSGEFAAILLKMSAQKSLED